MLFVYSRPTVLTAYRKQFQSDEIFRYEKLLLPSLSFFWFSARPPKANVFKCWISPLLSFLGLSFSFIKLSANAQSSISRLGLPFVFFPSTFPYLTTPIAAASKSPLSVCSIRLFCFYYCVYQGSFFSYHCQHFFVCCMFCPVDFSLLFNTIALQKHTVILYPLIHGPRL